MKNVAWLLMGRCFGGSMVNGRAWGRCRYLQRCLGGYDPDAFKQERLNNVT